MLMAINPKSMIFWLIPIKQDIVLICYRNIGIYEMICIHTYTPYKLGKVLENLISVW